MRNCKAVLLLVLIFVIGVFLTAPALAYTVPSDTLVYVTPKGEKYHREDCTYLTTATSMTIAAAEIKGYTPCSRCDPNILTGEYISNWDGHSGGSGNSKTSPNPTLKPSPSPSPVPQKNSSLKLNWAIIWLITAVVLTIVDIRQIIKSDNAEQSLALAKSELRQTKDEATALREKLEYILKKHASLKQECDSYKQRNKRLVWIHEYDGIYAVSAFGIPADFILTDDEIPKSMYEQEYNEDFYLNSTGIYHRRSCFHVSCVSCKRKKLWEVQSSQPCKQCKPPHLDFSWYDDFKTTVLEMRNDGLTVYLVDGVLHVEENEAKI